MVKSNQFTVVIFSQFYPHILVYQGENVIITKLFTLLMLMVTPGQFKNEQAAFNFGSRSFPDAV
jgi:hypothetical protein